MATRNRAMPSSLAAFTPRELNQMIPVPEGAELLGVHADTFRKHFKHLIVDVGPRLQRVRLGDVLKIGTTAAE